MPGDPRWEGERRWALDQIDEQGLLNDEERSLVMDLLEAWWDGTGDMNPWAALDAFETLARGKALEVPEQADPRWRWEQAKPGQIMIRDYVRVKADAYQGETGRKHNGRAGWVVRTNMGDIHVRYDDGKPPLGSGLPPAHSPHNLEKRRTA